MLPSPTHTTPELSLCSYVNATARMEVVRITNIPHWYFERVILPGQRLIFSAPAGAKLEVHTGMHINMIQSETIDCHQLQLSPLPSDYYAVSVVSSQT